MVLLDVIQKTMKTRMEVKVMKLGTRREKGFLCFVQQSTQQ